MSDHVTTPLLGLIKPAVGGADGVWADYTNTNWDTLDQVLPLVGGSLSGGLDFGSVYAADRTTTTRHLRLYNGFGAAGINPTNGFLNYNAPSSWNHCFRTGGVDRVFIGDQFITLSTGYSLRLGGNATNALDAVPLQQLQAGYLPLTGGVVTGATQFTQPLITAAGTAGSGIGLGIGNNTTGFWTSGGNNLVLQAGGTSTVINSPTSTMFQVPITLPADPTTAMQAATKQYVDAHGGGSSVTISDTPPASPKVGDQWWDSVSCQMFVWYQDQTSSQWVPATAVPASVGEAPNDQWSYLRHGAAWQSHGALNGNLGVGIPVPALQAAPNPTYGGGWLFGWGLTSQNLTSNGYWDGANWRFQRASETVSLFSLANGGFSWMNSPAQGAADTVASLTETMRLGAGGDLSLTGQIQPAGPVQITYGNICALNTPTGNPSVFCWDNSQNAAAGMFLGGTSTLYFASMDGAGNFQKMYAGFDAAGTLSFPGNPVSDPLNLAVAQGYACRVRTTVGNVRTWSCGVVPSGDFEIADQTGGMAHTYYRTSGTWDNYSTTININSANGFHYGALAGLGATNSIGFVWNGTNAMVGVAVDGGGAFYYIANASDERIKEQIADSAFDSLAAINQIQLREFYWKTEMPTPFDLRDAKVPDGAAKVRVGIVAQEVNQILPEAVRRGDDHDDKLGQIWGIDNNIMEAALIGAIQQLTKRVQDLEARLAV